MPVTKLAFSLSKNATTWAISSGCPTRPTGYAGRFMFRFISSTSSASSALMGVAISPGAQAFTRMPFGERSNAICLTSPFSPCFDTV